MNLLIVDDIEANRKLLRVTSQTGPLSCQLWRYATKLVGRHS
jgi:hypothetical protein